MTYLKDSLEHKIFKNFVDSLKFIHDFGNENRERNITNLDSNIF